MACQNSYGASDRLSRNAAETARGSVFADVDIRDFGAGMADGGAPVSSTPIELRRGTRRGGTGGGGIPDMDAEGVCLPAVGVWLRGPIPAAPRDGGREWSRGEGNGGELKSIAPGPILSLLGAGIIDGEVAPDREPVGILDDARTCPRDGGRAVDTESGARGTRARSDVTIVEADKPCLPFMSEPM